MLKVATRNPYFDDELGTSHAIVIGTVTSTLSINRVEPNVLPMPGAAGLGASAQALSPSNRRSPRNPVPPRVCLDARGDFTFERFRIGPASQNIHLGLLERLEQNHCVLALLWSQVTVARTQRQPVGFPRSWDHLDLNGDIEIAHHLLKHANLLSVLLSEEANVSLHHVEQFQDHRGHTLEVAGPRFSFHALLNFLHSDTCLKSGRIDFRLFGNEDHIDTFGPAQVQILFQSPGIPAKVFLWAKLGWIDENRHHHKLATGPGPANQAGMAFVQSAHGEDQANVWPLARAAAVADRRSAMAETCVHVEFMDWVLLGLELIQMLTGLSGYPHKHLAHERRA